MIDYEQLAQESALFPWLDSDCMSDNFDDERFIDPDAFFDDVEEDWFFDFSLHFIFY